jgi:hypothetical protein
MVLPQKQTEKQWNRINNAVINLYSYSHLKFNKEEKTASSINGVGKTEYLHTETTSMSFTLYKYQIKMDQKS